MKQKFISLALAVMLLLGVTGCAMSTPASVGSIGGVDIPAGIYLLAQYNAYNTASGAAKLATGETASNVKAVLKAECTGTINGEEVTTDGADYVARLTLRSLQYYAAVEKKFGFYRIGNAVAAVIGVVAGQVRRRKQTIATTWSWSAFTLLAVSPVASIPSGRITAICTQQTAFPKQPWKSTS